MLQNEQASDLANNPLLSEARERSLNEDLHQLAQDARAYAEAELRFQKSRAAYTASASKSIAVYGLAALVLVFFAVMALVVGLLLALTPLITAWGATALVTLALLGLAVFLLLQVKKRVTTMTTILSGERAP